MTVKEVLDRYPHLLNQFLELKLLCVGCPAEAFHTLGNTAEEHNLDLDRLIHRFQRAIEAFEAINVHNP